MVKIKKIKIIKKETKKLSLILDCGGIKYKTKADDISEAVAFIYEKSFGKIKTWGIFTLKIGKKKAQMQLRPIQIKRIFVNHFARDIFEKRILMILE